ncbi:hypothetical protein XELAEV_18016989mg [Xenopus laevis]|uniref:Uncharacterized protein n=1 Tax=Xenopus laevis TaxID=8355 RepID=A0A974DAB1_XENLA|nr:hypothetical protein XELAEV_18016989mg [Xenopus laevis]
MLAATSAESASRPGLIPRSALTLTCLQCVYSAILQIHCSLLPYLVACASAGGFADRAAPPLALSLNACGSAERFFLAATCFCLLWAVSDPSHCC